MIRHLITAVLAAFALVGCDPQKTKVMITTVMIINQSHFECLRIVPIIS